MNDNYHADRWAAEQAILDHADRFAFMGQQWVPRGPRGEDEACAVYRTATQLTTVRGINLAPLFDGVNFNFARRTSQHIGHGLSARASQLVERAIGAEAAARSDGTRTNGPSWNDNDCQSQDEVEEFLRHAAKRVWDLEVR